MGALVAGDSPVSDSYSLGPIKVSAPHRVVNRKKKDGSIVKELEWTLQIFTLDENSPRCEVVARSPREVAEIIKAISAAVEIFDYLQRETSGDGFVPLP